MCKSTFCRKKSDTESFCEHILIYHNLSMFCLIPDGDEVILTGGRDTSYINYPYNAVSKYNRNGWVSDVAPMISRRYDHACGSFMNSNNEVVNVL